MTLQESEVDVILLADMTRCKLFDLSMIKIKTICRLSDLSIIETVVTSEIQPDRASRLFDLSMIKIKTRCGLFDLSMKSKIKTVVMLVATIGSEELERI